MPFPSKQPFTSLEQVKSKLLRYCTYQERTYRQVRAKMQELGWYGSDAEEYLLVLAKEGFIDESRYAVAYALGKFNQCKWGRVKIRYGLSMEGLSKYCIEQGMAAITDEHYEQVLQKLYEQLSKTHSGNSYQKHLKTKSQLIRKGYEGDKIDEVKENLLNKLRER